MADEAPKKDKKEAKVKKPSALKRDIQAQKNRARNRSHRAQVLTAIRTLSASLSTKEPADATKKKLDAIYSLMDKGVKRGVFKANKASRTKSRLTAQMNRA
jgi:small subunit ribosomal protein S20